MKINQTEIRCMLFDLDGTLTESGPGIKAAFRHAFSAIGREAPADLTPFIGPPLEDSFRNLPGADDALVEAAVKAYKAFYMEQGWLMNSVYDGIPEALARLKEQGLLLGVSTSKAEFMAKQILAHFSLAPFFDEIVGSLPGGRQAKADVIAHALTLLSPEDKATVAMVGDRCYDAAGARANGLHFIGALWGYGSPEELKNAGAAVLVRTPAELAD